MFEDKTQEAIMEQMLENIDPSIDTREGSIIYDAIAPIAVELEQAYSDLGLILEECFADSASYYYLIKRAAERGVFVEEGTAAVIKVKAAPSDVDIPIGTEFNIGENNYTITENLSDGYYSLTCTETGIGGNDVSDDVIPMDDVDGLEGLEVVEIISRGTDDEDQESLRERYFKSFNEVAFGGNKEDYREKANEFECVGGCKPIRAWNGGGTVKLIIINAGFGPANSNEVSEVQEGFDPTQEGTGDGIAPIGHVVTVESAAEYVVTIQLSLEYQEGYIWEDVKDSIKIGIEEYFLSLRKTWGDEKQGLTVRTGQIETIVLNVVGIKNVTGILLNGLAGNIVIDEYKIPKVGEISGT